MRALVALVTVLALSAADGTFRGKWGSSRSDANGEIAIRIRTPADVSFTYNGQEVKTTVAHTKYDETKFEIDYDFSLEGYKLRSSLKGAINGSKVTGQYTTKSLEDDTPVDAGTFEATSQ